MGMIPTGGSFLVCERDWIGYDLFKSLNIHMIIGFSTTENASLGEAQPIHLGLTWQGYT